jgi:ribonucleoside-diphosphate reductase alpha chain
MEGGDWTLFSPQHLPRPARQVRQGLREAYTAYEAKVDRGEIKLFKRMPAKDLWRKMLSMLFETGHPWITFKDACNVRSPQQHVGVVHSSNLCTEITLNTSDTEIAVCNLGSVNLAQHLKDGQIDQDKLKRTVSTAMRMLDNVIDINYYAVKKARDSNLRTARWAWASWASRTACTSCACPTPATEAVEFADRSMEAVCYYAYWASTELAEERGRYSSYRGSLWDRGILPQDTLDLLAEARGGYVEVDRSSTLDWDALRQRIAAARHAQLQLRGHRADGHHLQHHRRRRVHRAELRQPVGQVEPVGRVHRHQRVPGARPEAPGPVGRRDGDGPQALRRLAAPIDRVPEELKRLYATAFEVDATWLVEAAARRQKWIDQAQSLNIYMAGASGKKLDETYKLAWLRGLKTTYYLRTTSATYTEKSTVAPGAMNAVSMQGRCRRLRRHRARARQRHQVLLHRQPRLRSLPVNSRRCAARTRHVCASRRQSFFDAACNNAERFQCQQVLGVPAQHSDNSAHRTIDTCWSGKTKSNPLR